MFKTNKAAKVIVVIVLSLIFTFAVFVLGSNNYTVPKNVNNTKVDIIKNEDSDESFEETHNNINENSSNSTVKFKILYKQSNDENSSTEQLDNENSAYFEILFIDVGQGDSILVSCDNKYMLIDGGPSNASSVIYTILKEREITYLDYIINTHPDEDHVGGLSGALNYAKVGKVFSPYKKETREYESFAKYVSEAGSSIEMPNIGDSFNLGSSTIDIIATNIGSFNEASIIVKITYGNNSFLMMADAGTEVENYLLNNDIDITCDLLKIGHHGSEYGTGYNFLDSAKPKYAVISVGSNSYGHPSEEVLSKLKEANIATYRTDLQGDILVKSDGEYLTIETERNSEIDTFATTN